LAGGFLVVVDEDKAVVAVELGDEGGEVINPVAGTPAGTELTGLEVAAFVLDDFHDAGDEGVVVGATGEDRLVGAALGLAEDAG